MISLSSDLTLASADSMRAMTEFWKKAWENFLMDVVVAGLEVFNIYEGGSA